MKIKDIENFFQEVDRRIDFPIEVMLTGGAAGILYGTERATFDIDFEIHIVGKNEDKEQWGRLEKVFIQVSDKTRIAPQYATDIDRWSAIPLPMKKSSLYKKFEHVTVRILSPELWAIGKLTRFISADIEDLHTVLRLQKTDQKKCVRLWGQALRQSSPSLAQARFPRQVEQFLDKYAKLIWGKTADAAQLKELFWREAKKQ